MSGIIFDGDSVISPHGFGIPIECQWPHMIAGQKKYTNIGRHQLTAAKCRTGIWKIFLHAPSHYVLQIGQWSSSNEPIEEFEANVERIIKSIRLKSPHTKIHLITPTYSYNNKWNTEEYSHCIKRIAIAFNTHFYDLYKKMQSFNEGELATIFIPDGDDCHLSTYGHSAVFGMLKEMGLLT